MGNSQKLKKPKDVVVYSNNYVEALYQTGYLAKKIMIAAILCCGDENWLPNDSGGEVVMTASELREMVGIDRGSLQYLELAVKKLTETSVTVRDPQDPGNGWEIFNYLPFGKYKNGVLTLLINPKMRPLVENLQKNFTQYHIENIKPLKSGYSIRIFELLKMHAFKSEYKIDVNELRRMFGLEEKYKKYNDFKKDVLEKAKKELKQHCEIWFEYKEIKNGRKVSKILFLIYKQEKPFSVREVFPVEKSKNGNSDSVVIEAIPVEESNEVQDDLINELIKNGFVGAEKFLKEESRELVEEALKIIKGQGGISNPGGLLREKVRFLKEKNSLKELGKQKKEQREQEIVRLGEKIKEQEEEGKKRNREECVRLFNEMIQKNRYLFLKEHGEFFREKFEELGSSYAQDQAEKYFTLAEEVQKHGNLQPDSIKESISLEILKEFLAKK